LRSASAACNGRGHFPPNTLIPVITGPNYITPHDLPSGAVFLLWMTRCGRAKRFRIWTPLWELRATRNWMSLNGGSFQPAMEQISDVRLLGGFLYMKSGSLRFWWPEYAAYEEIEGKLVLRRSTMRDGEKALNGLWRRLVDCRNAKEVRETRL